MTKAIFFQRIKHVLTAGHFPKPRTAPTLATLMLGAALGGCAIHPVQQDVTGLPTKEIVDRIRCEARLAVVDKAIDLLRRKASDLYAEAEKPENARSVIAIKTIAKKFHQAAHDLDREKGGIITFDDSMLPTKEAKMLYARYIDTAIAYEFSFNITEDNSAIATLDPIRLLTNGSAGIGIGGTGDFKRNNIRRFALTDSFRELIYQGHEYCMRREYLPENFIYPISGSVGLKGLIDTFIDLYEDKPLEKLDKGQNVFGDTLQFTTNLLGSVSPKIELNPLGTRFGLASPTNVAFSASRLDVHMLTIGLSIGSESKTSNTKSRIGNFLSSTSSRTSQKADSGPRNNKERALETIEDQRMKNFFDRAGTLILR